MTARRLPRLRAGSAGSQGRDFPVKLQRCAAVAGAGFIAAATLSACGSNNNTPTASGSSGSSSSSSAISCGSGTLTLAGSSAQANAIAKWTKDYQAACSGATINYNPSGSGAGVTAFEQKQVDFAGSDFPLSGADVAKANARCTGGEAADLPMVPGPIPVIHHVSRRTAPPHPPASTPANVFHGQ